MYKTSGTTMRGYRYDSHCSVPAKMAISLPQSETKDGGAFAQYKQDVYPERLREQNSRLSARHGTVAHDTA